MTPPEQIAREVFNLVYSRAPHPLETDRSARPGPAAPGSDGDCIMGRKRRVCDP